MTEGMRAHCQSLRLQRMRLCSLQQQRERIASHMVHDLKEPLSAIDLRSSLLLLDTNLPDQARVLIERVRTQARSALLQVLNLLDIRMLDEGHLEARYAPVDLYAWCASY
jgi:signal transduction histidine kinase